MKTLRMTIEWLDGRYHGAQWPPSPWRLFQAMVAGLGPRRRLDPGLEAALRHLETLDPPAITAPQAQPLCALTSRVPTNDADRVLALDAKGEWQKARLKAMRLGSLHTRRAWRVEGAVVYDFKATTATAAHLPSLVRAARAVSALGHGIDLTLASAALLDELHPVGGIRHAPRPRGRLLAVPWSGALDALDARHLREQSRIRASRIEIRSELSPRMQGYRSELEPPPVRWEAHCLKGRDGGTLAVDGVQAMAVAAGLRGAALKAKRGGATVGFLVPLPRTDPVLARFLAGGLVWTSATPVVLPGWDSRRGRVRPARAVRRLLGHAGLAEALLACAAIERRPRLSGSGAARSYLRPDHLADYPATHLSLAWTSHSRGPRRSGARSRSGRARGTGSGSSSRSRRRSSTATGVTSKEIQPARVRPERDDVHPALRGRVWTLHKENTA